MFSDAVFSKLCDLLGDPSEVKTSRRYSITTMDEHEVSNVKSKEKELDDSYDWSSLVHREPLVNSHSLSRSEKMIDNKDSLLTSSSFTSRSPAQHRHRSLNFTVADYIDSQKLQIDRLCDKVCHMENVHDRKQTLMTSSSEKQPMKKYDGGCILPITTCHEKTNLVNGFSNAPPKQPIRILSPKPMKQTLRQSAMTLLCDS